MQRAGDVNTAGGDQRDSSPGYAGGLTAAVMSVSFDQLSDWGVTLDEALAIARENLWKMSNEPFSEVAPGVYFAEWGDAFDAARMFLHDLIWQLKVSGDHVVVIPARPGRSMTAVSGRLSMKLTTTSQDLILPSLSKYTIVEPSLAISQQLNCCS